MNGQLVYILDSFPGPTAGTEGQFWLLYKLMCSKGSPPRIVTLRPSEFLQREAPSHYECLHIDSLASVQALKRAYRFAQQARAAGVRLAHLFLNDTSVLLPVFLWLFGIKVIISRRDLGFWYTAGILRVLRTNRFFVDIALANCGAVAQVTQDKEGYPARKLRTILNGCERPAATVPMDLRAEYGIPREAVILGMVANLRPLKGVQDAIWAVATLKLIGTDARLFVAGADVIQEGVSQKDKLQRLAQELSVSDRVVFLGPVQSSWPFLAALDVFLSCSSSEGLSNSIVEAMSAGVPVVASAVGGTPSIIEHERTGLLYPPGKLDELVACIAHYCESPLYRQHIAEEAHVFAENNLSAGALLHAHEELYAELLGLKGGPKAESCPRLAAQ